MTPASEMAALWPRVGQAGWNGGAGAGRTRAGGRARYGNQHVGAARGQAGGCDGKPTDIQGCQGLTKRGKGKGGGAKRSSMRPGQGGAGWPRKAATARLRGDIEADRSLRLMKGAVLGSPEKGALLEQLGLLAGGHGVLARGPEFCRGCRGGGRNGSKRKLPGTRRDAATYGGERLVGSTLVPRGGGLYFI